MTQKIAYLTIDDAPSPSLRMKTDYLHSKGIPAIFFCVGKSMEDRPELVVDAIQKGFVIGNHSYDHPHFSDLPLPECYQQIERTDQIIEHLYSQAGVRRPARLFRFPFGDKGGLTYSNVFLPYEGEGAARKAALQNYLRQSGYFQPRFEGVTYQYFEALGLRSDIDWHWTYDVMEWSIFFEPHLYDINSLESLYERMEENEPEGCRGLNEPGSEEIILLHDHVESDALFVPIITRLLEKGLQFRLPELAH